MRPSAILLILYCVTAPLAYGSDPKTPPCPGGLGKVLRRILQRLEKSAADDGPIPFLEKFKRQRAGIEDPVFQPGEVIEGTFRVEPVRSTLGIDRSRIRLVYDDGRIDERHTDFFFIAVEPSQYAAYVPFIGGKYRGKVRIHSKGKYVGASNMFDYPASIVGKLEETGTVNPSPQQVAAMADGTEAKIEGKIVGMIRDPEEKGPRGVKKLVVETPAGKRIEVDLESGLPSYVSSADPSFEVKGHDWVEVGDTVRINGFANRGRLRTEWVGTTTLVEPSAARAAAYQAKRAAGDQGRARIAAALQSKDYPAVRKEISLLAKKGADLTTDEKAFLRESVAQLPAAERPLLLWRRAHVNSTNAAYGVDLDALTRDQLQQFFEEVSLGKIEPKEGFRGKAYSRQDVTRIMEEAGFEEGLGFPEEFKTKIFLQGAETRLEQLSRLAAQGIEEAADEYGSRDVILHENWSALAALKRQTPEVAEGLIRQARLYKSLAKAGKPPPYERILRSALEENWRAALASGDAHWKKLYDGLAAANGKPEFLLGP